MNVDYEYNNEYEYEKEYEHEQVYVYKQSNKNIRFNSIQLNSQLWHHSLSNISHGGFDPLPLRDRTSSTHTSILEELLQEISSLFL